MKEGHKMNISLKTKGFWGVWSPKIMKGNNVLNFKIKEDQILASHLPICLMWCKCFPTLTLRFDMCCPFILSGIRLWRSVWTCRCLRWQRGAYQHPAVEADAQGQVKSRDYQQCPEPLQQQGNEADLEHVGVEHHQENDDHVEQDGYVLDAAGTELVCF